MTHLKKLDRIQYEACRIMLGALRCTPGYKLEIEADLLPLEIRRQKLLLEYGVRLYSKDDHPIRTFLQEQDQPPIRIPSTWKEPAITHIYHDLNMCGINTSNIISILLKAQYDYCTLPIKCSLAEDKKALRSSQQWQILFKSLIENNYPNHHQIYTDGSCKNNRSSYAIYNPMFQVLNRIDKNTSKFTTELNLYSSQLHQTEDPWR